MYDCYRAIRGYVVALALVPAVGAGCGSSSDSGGTTPTQTGISLAVACNDTFDTFYQVPDGMPAFDDSQRGAVVRCSPAGSYTLDQLDATATTLGYHGSIMKSGTTAYRVAYRTQRATRADGTTPDGIASATLFVPDHIRGADGTSPLLVVGHGTVGIGGRCAPSRGDLTATGGHLDDYRALVIPLVAAGWVVIAPDYPGYGYGETTGYMLAEDVAHGLLDATRAATKLFKPGVLSGKVVFVGHSQGGHAAISAQAYASSYGMDGTLVGVATMAPMWFSELGFAAMLSPLAGYTTSADPYPLSYALAYFYTHGENLDGPGHGLDMFQAAKQDAVRNIATNDCLYEAAADMPSLGAKPSDFFDTTFAQSVGVCGVTGTCDGVSQVWGERCRADRPAIDAHGAPLLIWQGGADTTISPGLAVCGLDKLKSDLSAVSDASTTIKFCVDPTATHSGFTDDKGVDLSAAITRRSMDWVAQWIDARTVGGAEPADCVGEEAFDTDAGPTKCSTPPPND